MIVINIEKKMRTYKGYEQLKVDSWLPANSITKISGPSGAGKTTLLKIIGGLIIPEKGKLSFDGQLWLDTDQKFALSPQKRNIGFVFQNYALFPNMTVLQHLQYATNDAAWIDRLLHFGKLETLVKHKPEFLSGGQQQRLAILRALAIKPRLLLMDEPFSALDHDMRSELIRDLYSLIKELDASCIIVSHNPNEVEHIATHHIKIGY
jgi:molybdate transport system ATP-binding protein